MQTLESLQLIMPLNTIYLQLKSVSLSFQFSKTPSQFNYVKELVTAF